MCYTVYSLFCDRDRTENYTSPDRFIRELGRKANLKTRTHRLLQ